jgi:type VI secretion system protein ImpM
MPGAAVTALAPPGPQWLAAAGPAGWFGKLASLGDFGSRRLPPQFTQACDQWLSRGVASSQALLGERWLDAYLTAPVWRFAWGPGVVNPQWWIGVLMPSVDRVGRYFPLLVAQAGFNPPATPRALAQAEPWFERVQAAMLGTLQAGGTVEAFDAALTGLPDWDDGASLPPPEPQRLPERQRFESAEGVSMGAWLPRVATASWLQGLQGRSLWWPVREGAERTAVSVTHGLPAAERFVDLLDASW